MSKGTPARSVRVPPQLQQQCEEYLLWRMRSKTLEGWTYSRLVAEALTDFLNAHYYCTTKIIKRRRSADPVSSEIAEIPPITDEEKAGGV